MRKSFLGISLALVLALTLFPGFALKVSADLKGQSDHALLNAAAGDHIHCGVETKKAEPWTLYVAATADTAGTLTIRFGDGDAITFNVPAGGSFSTTQALGGVPGVDDVVMIEAAGGVTAAMASALVRDGAGVKDPFTGDGEKDNFCLTHPGDPGVAPFE